MLNYLLDNFRVITEIAGKLSEAAGYNSTHIHIGKSKFFQVVLKMMSCDYILQRLNYTFLQRVSH